MKEEEEEEETCTVTVYFVNLARPLMTRERAPPFSFCTSSSTSTVWYL